MANIAIIPAAGNGSRMQAGVNKQYFLLAGRPILAHTLAIFAAPPPYRPDPPRCPGRGDRLLPRRNRRGVTALGKVSRHYRRRPAPGRIPSPTASFACDAARDDLVIIHYGARPLLAAAELDALLDAPPSPAGRRPWACRSRIRSSRSRMALIVATPERSSLWQVQTPQAFRFLLPFRRPPPGVRQ